jgi:predicted Zn-dependent protease with MMP-like domain
VDNERFEELVIRAVESLPEELKERLDNVDVMVADKPSPDQLDKSDRKRGQILLGLYEGVPLTHRHSSYGLVTPDRITIFKKAIESVCHSDDQTVREIRRVVLHEIAHHFGIDDERLRELGM